VRGLAAVFGREIAERRMLPLVALGLGLVPLGAAYFPGVGLGRAAEVRSGMASLLALGLTAALALILGGSVIARDLGEKRLGFYFARPLGGWTIWGGKLAAAAALTLGGGLLVLLPTSLLDASWPDPGLVFGFSRSTGLWTAVGLGAGFLLLVSHALGVILRARSAWLALDLAGALAVYVLLALASRRLTVAGADMARTWILSSFAGLAMIALLLAGAAQLVEGRTDPRRGHRALSLWLWSLLLAGSLGVHAYTGWELAGTPRDLSQVGDVIASRGSWIAVDGWDSARKLWSAFLMDVASGRSQRIRSAWGGMDGMLVAFAPGEGWAAWLEPPPGMVRGVPLSLRALDLRRPGSRPQESPVVYDRWPEALALSADGARVAAVLGKRLLVAEVATGNPIASAKLPGDIEFWPSASFVGTGRVRLRGFRMERVAADRSWSWQTWELDLTDRQLRPLGAFGPYKGTWNPTGGRAVRFNPDLKALELFDGWTGRTLAWRPWTEAPVLSTAIVSGGRVALVTAAGGGSEVRVLAPDLSAELLRIPVPGKAPLSLRGQPAPDLLVAVTRPPGSRTTSRTLLLDLAAGSSRELGEVEPVFSPEPGSAGSRLFRNRSRRLLRLDPRTGRLHPFLGAEGRS
jgi:hypothetical protein